MDVTRFAEAHQSDYETALAEVRAGYKRSHWMWYIFPQIAGLGSSATAQRYAIESLEEARVYLAHPLLGRHMRELCNALLDLDTNDAQAVFGGIDAMKLRSSMTLFSLAAPLCDGWEDNPFADVLDKFYDGDEDELTLQIIATADEHE